MSNNTYRYEGGNIHFKFSYDKDMVRDVKNLIAVNWNNVLKEWVVPILDGREEEICDFIFKWGFVEKDTTLKKAEQIIKYKPIDYAFIDGKLSMLDLPMKPRDYQLQTIAYGLDKRKFINALDMGLGKTYVSILCVEITKSFPCLVITPASVKVQFAEVWGKMFKNRTVSYIETKETKNRKNNWDADVVVINYDILGRLVDNGRVLANGKPSKSLELRFPELVDKKWKYVIIDEAHKVNNSKAARSKAVRKITKSVDYIQLLTGTPVNKKPKNIINLIKILGRFDEIFKSYNTFVYNYCNAHYEFGRLNTDGASNIIELNQKLRDSCYIRFEKRDVLDSLPKITRTIIDTPLSNKAKYNKLELSTSGLNYDGAEGLALMEKQRQMSIELKMKFIEQYLKDWIDSGEKLVIFGEHRDPLIKLHNKFGGGLIIGGVSSANKKKAVDDFNKDGEQFIFVNIASGGTGVDGLQNNCSNVLFIELPYNPDDFEQAISRVDRSGASSAINVTMLLNMEGVDGYIWNNILSPKIVVSNGVNRGIEEDNTQDVKRISAKNIQKGLH